MKKKRFFFLFAALTICFVAFSQDIIVKKDTKRIEAKVVEVNVDNIRYRLASNPEGPLYTLLKAEIAYITYHNGDVESFEGEVALDSIYATDVEATSETYNEEFLFMTDREQEIYLKNTSSDLYNQFRTGQSLGRTGKRLAIPGIFLNGIGVGLIMIGALSLNKYSTGYGYNYSYQDGGASAVMVIGYVSVVVGQALLITSIPLRAVGGGMKKSVQDTYERRMDQRSSMSQFQFNLYNNAVGVAYVF